jgi:predicted nucleic-acid-binding Zn-ribbon protein
MNAKMETMGYLGYAECDSCGKFNYYLKAEDISIWFHPDDPYALTEATCKKCGYTVVSRISHDHLRNFMRRGCALKDFSDRFKPLTEEEIDEWDIEAEWESVK